MTDDDLSSLLGNDAGELASADNPFAPPSESQPAASQAQASSPLASQPALRNPSVSTPAPVDLAGAPMPPSAPPAPAPVNRREDRTAALPKSPEAASDEGGSALFWRPGTVFAGRYTLLEEMGHGGMGRVFKAQDMELARIVAIKLMRSSMRLHEHAAALTDRFQAEALLPARLNHPNIIAIYDRGTHVIHDERFPFFVMEFLPDARSLHEEIQQARSTGRPIDLERIRSWFIQAASALASLHATGAWHRDIKPANFLIYPLHDVEHLKLLDFGIAHLPDSGLTVDGSILGTPSHMAPEFFEVEGGKSLELDYRGDLFALGITLYQCLTLQHPYPSVKTTRDALAAYKGGAAVLPPSRHRPELPPAWDHVTLALLERDRSKRLQPAVQVLAALRALPTAPVQPGAPPAPSELLANDAAIVLTSIVSPGVPPAAMAAEPHAPQAPVGLSPSHQGPQSSSGQSGAASSHAPAVQPPQPSPPTDWANAFRPESGAPRKRAVGSFMLAGVVLLAVFGALAFVFSGIGQKVVKTKSGAGAWNMPGEQKPPADAWMTEVEQAPLFPTSRSRATAPPHQGPELAERESSSPAAPATPQSPQEAARSEQPSKRGGSKGARSSSAASPAADDPWAALYGNGGPTNNGAISVRNGGDGGGDSGSVQGMRLDARLIDKVASRPTGSAVIVKLTKEAKLGTHKFPIGAEVHGKVTGADGNRIFVSFEFIRFGNNEVVRISGVVRGKDGRQGLPGKKQLDGNAGQSVATAGASSAISGAAGAAAGAIAGPVAGGVVQGVGDSASQKVERLDNDEALVIATGNTPVVVYVSAMPDG